MFAFIGILGTGLGAGLIARHWMPAGGPVFGTIGAAAGALVAHACGLYRYGAPQGYVAALVGAVLVLIAYGGPIDRPLVAAPDAVAC